mmetsp:Transcript_38534/g.115440  ORF Transcript_38534/g.115440 Transcript_38534/m.115440 type:complete len:250 (-) Transcript_38534:403-1152(-)
MPASWSGVACAGASTSSLGAGGVGSGGALTRASAHSLRRSSSTSCRCAAWTKSGISRSGSRVETGMNGKRGGVSPLVTGAHTDGSDWSSRTSGGGIRTRGKLRSSITGAKSALSASALRFSAAAAAAAAAASRSAAAFSAASRLALASASALTASSISRRAAASSSLLRVALLSAASASALTRSGVSAAGRLPSARQRYSGSSPSLPPAWTPHEALRRPHGLRRGEAIALALPSSARPSSSIARRAGCP